MQIRLIKSSTGITVGMDTEDDANIEIPSDSPAPDVGTILQVENRGEWRTVKVLSVLRVSDGIVLRIERVKGE